MPVLAHHHIVGPGDQGQNAQRSLYLQKGDREIARCGPQMEAQKCGEIEPHPAQLARFLSAQVAGQGERSLFGIVGGEDGGAGVALSTGEGAPLHAHGKKDRVEGGENGHILREKSQQNGTGGINERTDTPHIPAEQMGQDHGGHGTQHINNQSACMQQDTGPVAAQRIQEKLQQIQGLGVGHDTHPQEDGIGGEKAAYRGKRQMAIPVYIGTSAHRNTTFRVRVDTSIAEKCRWARGKMDKKERGLGECIDKSRICDKIGKKAEMKSSSLLIPSETGYGGSPSEKGGCGPLWSCR